MGRISHHENLRNARILQIQDRFDSLGVKTALADLRSVKPKRKWVKVDYGSWPRRSSPRLDRTFPFNNNGGVQLLEESKAKSRQPIAIGIKEEGDDLEMNEPCLEATRMCITPNDYESIRNSRIQENQARLALLGVQKALSDLRSVISSEKPVRKNKIVDYGLSPLRRSSRLKPTTAHNGESKCYADTEEEWEEKSPANVSLSISVGIGKSGLSPEIVARRCSSKNRGTVYHPAGISCHFCRQKTLCSEEECKHCGNLDMDQPCMGKTECSICHSSNGILCRACLKVRYGEEMEEVRDNKEWKCPHCIEDKGINPYWICNSSFCLKKRKLAPTGVAIFKAREMGFKSVAHLLMDQLQRNQIKMLSFHS